MSLKYKCLFLDHDDTSVNSTPEIHFQAHLEIMEKMRPSFPVPTLEHWFLKNFDPGIMEYLKGDLGMDPDEIKAEYQIWRKYTQNIVPDFFPGLIEILIEYKKRGGKVIVVSHSEVDLIERDYLENINKTGLDFFPDIIFGWTYDETKRKPDPWPVNEGLNRFSISADDALILDDLKPGVVMGKRAGVKIAAAGWGYDIKEIREFMAENCDHYLNKVEDLRSVLFSD
jgi:phosphoglycolate phosphatase/pyrophosphatase PpaX